jgi:outer membrane protein assembly factor BamB
MTRFRIIILVALSYMFLITPAYSLSEPAQLSYPPLTSTPSDMLVDNYGYVWVTLPMENRVCRIDVSSGSIRIVNLPAAATKILKAGDKLVAYQRGSEKAFLIDPATLKIAASIEMQKPLENAWPSPNGFWAKLTGTNGLFQVGEDGTIIKEYAAEVMDSELALSEYGKVVWYVGSDGKSISRLDTLTGAPKTLKLEKFVYAILAASENNAWIVTSDGSVSLISSDSSTPLKTFKPKSGIVGINKMYLIERDRIVFVNAASGVVGEIDGEVINEQSLGGDLPTLADIFKKSKLYFIDVKKKILGLVIISNPPEIVSSSTKIRSESEILVEATIRDREADLRDGYPQIRIMQGNKEIARVPMTLTADDKYVGLVPLSNINGKISIIVEAADWGDNVERSNVGTFDVNNGRIVTTTATTQTTTTAAIAAQASPATIDIGQIMMLSLELVLLISLLAALFVIIRKKPRTRRAKRPK